MQDAIKKISSTVQQADLADQVPLVKLERNARSEFCIFLAVDGDEVKGIPGNLKQLLKLQCNIDFFEDYPLAPSEIESMVQRQNIEIHGFNSLYYLRQELDDPGDPFDDSDTWLAGDASSSDLMSNETLLHWASSVGEGTWELFAYACTVLNMAEQASQARSALRRLVLLGHIEVSLDGSSWSIAPSCFVRYPDSPDSGFLTGARSVPLLKSIAELHALVRTDQSYYPGPARVQVGPEIPQGENGHIHPLVVDAGPVSARLVEIVPDLAGWKDSLQEMPLLDPTLLKMEIWESEGFVGCDDVYLEGGFLRAKSGMYRLRHASNRSARTITAFFDEPSQRWLRADWYGMRFLAREGRQAGVQAAYDPASGSLLVPASQRWPLLFERILTLASGLLPRRADNANWLSYPEVPLGLARELCRKLNVELSER